MYQLQQDIQDYMLKNDLGISEMARMLGLESRQSFQYWLQNSKKNQTLEILEAFETLDPDSGYIDEEYDDELE